MTHVPLPRGFRAAGTYAGIKKPGRGFDLGVLIADEAYPAAAVFTQNALLGAHVHLCREHLAKNGGLVRAIAVNSGCANCATGQQGIDIGLNLGLDLLGEFLVVVLDHLLG